MGPTLWAKVQLNLFSKDLATNWTRNTLTPNDYACSMSISPEQKQTLQKRLERMGHQDPHNVLHEGALACLGRELTRAKEIWESGFAKYGEKDQVLMLNAATARFASERTTIPDSTQSVGRYAKTQGIDSKRRGDVVAAKAWYEMAFAYLPNSEVGNQLVEIYNQLVETDKIAWVWQELQTRNAPDTESYWFATGKLLELNGDLMGAFDAYMTAGEKSQQENIAYDRYRQAAQVATQAGATEQAVAAYQRAITLQPNRVGNYLSLGRLYLMQGAFDEAKRWLQLAHEIQPDDHQPVLLMGVAEREQGNLEAALQHFDQALEIRPSNPDILYEKALTLDRAKRRADAIAVLDRAIRLKTDAPELWRNILDKWRKYPNPDETPDKWWGKGKAAEQEEDWAKAAEFYHHGAEIAQPPDDYRFLEREAGMYRKLEDNEKARAIYQELIQRNPAQINAYLYLGEMARQDKNFDEATQWFTQAQQIAPQDPRPYYYLGLLAHQQQRYEDAVAYLEQSLSLNPENSTALYFKAVDLDKLKRRQEAIPVLARAIELRANPPESWQQLLAKWQRYPDSNQTPKAFLEKGKAAEQEKDWTKAAEIYHQGATVVHPPDDYPLLIREALMYRKLKEWDKAKAIYEDLIQRYPDKMDAYLERGEVARVQKAYDEAQTWYERGRQINPEDWRPYLYLGLGARAQKRYEDALTFFDQSLALRPDNPSVLYQKALTLNALGRQEEAINTLTQAIELHPKHPEGWKELLAKWQSSSE